MPPGLVCAAKGAAACQHVNTDLQRSHMVVTSLDSKMVQDMLDVLHNLPDNGNDTAQQHLQKLVTGLELSLHMPSQLQHHIHMLVGDSIINEVLYVKWLELVPLMVSRMLQILCNNTLDELPQAVDEIIDDAPWDLHDHTLCSATLQLVVKSRWIPDTVKNNAVTTSAAEELTARHSPLGLHLLLRQSDITTRIFRTKPKTADHHAPSSHPVSWILKEKGVKFGITSAKCHMTKPSASFEGKEASTSTGTTSIASQVMSQSNSTTENFQGTPSESTTQTPLNQFIHHPLGVKTSQHIDETLLKLLISQYLPFSLVEQPVFKTFIRSLNPNYQLPNRKTLENNYLELLYSKTANELREKLKESTAKKEILKIIRKWGLEGKNVAVASDNAANMLSAARNPGWIHIPCFAYTLNLLVQNSLTEIKDLQNRVKSVVEPFKRSSSANQKLKSLQGQTNYPTLKQEMPTRWNSTYIMFQSVIENKEPLLAALALTDSKVNLTLRDFNVMEQLYKLLVPLYAITIEISSEKQVTASKLIPFSQGILKYFELVEMEALYEEVALTLKKFARFSGIEDKALLAEATILDQRFKKVGFKIYPRLFLVMKRRLCVVGSSVPCERVFSKAGTILCERRRSLKPKRLSKLGRHSLMVNVDSQVLCQHSSLCASLLDSYCSTLLLAYLSLVCYATAGCSSTL
ncbi:hypothetical protein J437_LFUL018477 [Ladona fulva]|uniref:HAT C-terminal dimerisation domain-containing protein n=1 Tax=Ladona fulva TaxID=123851 RepID=A0A8K0KPK1_LADFU|nr:hypothetical protein J437_LFUL018477 [Ladona fulva]